MRIQKPRRDVSRRPLGLFHVGGEIQAGFWIPAFLPERRTKKSHLECPNSADSQGNWTSVLRDV